MTRAAQRATRRSWRLFVPWLVAVSVLQSGCRGPDTPPISDDHRSNVLVVTLDTIRADRLGAYGGARGASPFIDSLAARGVVFDRCAAPTPLTLPSHTSLFTGTYPIFHGVRDNGDYVVPEELTTMAELFADAGYRTGAFVGAYVLAARWGLDQGFETFSEPHLGFDPDLSSFAQIQRRADTVVDDALAWLATPSAAPFFAWVHLYDPHLPYDPPLPYSTDFADDPYLGEVAFADAQLARLAEFLSSSGHDGSTLIVFAGDHGEGLGDHGELDHGLLLYQTTVRVPLIIAGPGLASTSARRPEVVSLVDVLPTVAEVAGLHTPEAVQGRSLLPLLRGESFEERPVIAETLYPELHFGWSALAALQDRRFQFIRSSEPELYDLAADPGQERNLVQDRAEVLNRMTAELELQLERLSCGGLDASSTPDAATIARLQALGYLAGGVSPIADERDGNHDRPSPARMLWQYNLLLEAGTTLASGDAAAGEGKLRELVDANPDLIDAWVALGRLYRRQGRMADALAALEQAHVRRPLDPFLVAKLADAMIATGRSADAEALLSAALERHPDDPAMLTSRGRVMESTGRIEAAEHDFRRALALDPTAAPVHVRLAALALLRGNPGTAEAELDAAVGLDPKVPEASLFRGRLLESEGHLDEAALAYRDELDASPTSLPAALALSRLEGRRGRPAEQERVLRGAITANPHSPGPYLVLALTLLQRGERPREAIELAERALEQGPQGQELQMGYMILATLHERLGEPERAAAYARLAEQVR